MSQRSIAHATDKAFFDKHPHRRFLARHYAEGDGPVTSPITLFADDGSGTLREINLVIIKRIDGGRMRLLFAASPWPHLHDDLSIMTFLLSRRIDPVTMRRH